MRLLQCGHSLRHCLHRYVLVGLPESIPVFMDINLKHKLIRDSVFVGLLRVIGWVMPEVAGLEDAALMERPLCQSAQEFLIA